ncbi:hypothetical protein ABZ897_32585 [Nonomuraea sp. NPDC046802]|uniref:hypothetical protein n=1 Tax=Nonomuraea sp. NPDC046802 TaxID=3154919 RepID=UPI0033D64D41
MTEHGETPDFHSLHAQPPKPQPIRLAWYEPAHRTQRIRVILHTCECRHTVYELCSTAGQEFIRRTDRENGTVHETAWTLTSVARDTFSRILLGEAR